MQNFLNFNFLAILNLFILLLYPAVGYYRPASAPAGRRDVLGIIMLILTVIAVLADIVFIVKVLVS